MEEEQQQKKPTDDTAALDSDPELSHSPKKQKKIEKNTSTSPAFYNQDRTDHQDTLINRKNADYCSFSTTNKKPFDPLRANPIEQILHQAATTTSDLDSDEDEEKRKIAAAKKLLFPGAFATSFPEVEGTLRNERRQEFCPIYKDETPEEIALRQAKRKPIGSLLAKRIRWDDLKRKREENERQAQVPVRYGAYGPVYSNTYGQYNGNTTQNQAQQSFANPYAQYYAAVQNQYEQMAEINRIQQEYNGFWPGYSQQSSLSNNNQITQNSIQQQSQPYTYPYPGMYYNHMTSVNPNVPSPYTSTDYHAYFNHLQQQPPPPPPSEPYPY